MKRDVKAFIQDIIDAMDKADKFIGTMSYNDFIHDEKTVFAVRNVLEIIGEAVKNIPPEIKNQYPQIPWQDMAGLRNKLIHFYFGVKLSRVWRAVKEELPPVKPLILEMLKDLDKIINAAGKSSPTQFHKPR